MSRSKKRKQRKATTTNKRTEFPRDQYDFMICDPTVGSNDYLDDLRYNLQKISSLVTVQEYEMAMEGDVRFAMVKLRLSPLGKKIPGITLNQALEAMCWSMTTTRIAWVEFLTTKSVWGIRPISNDFRMHWTRAFFDGVFTQSFRVSLAPLDALQEQNKPYIPPSVRFCLAVFAATYTLFALLEYFYVSNIIKLWGFGSFKAVVPMAIVSFRWISDIVKDNLVTNMLRLTYNASRIMSRCRYQEINCCFRDVITGTVDLVQDPKWVTDACNRFFGMTTNAVVTLAGQRDLTDYIQGSLEREYWNIAMGLGIAAVSMLVGIITSTASLQSPVLMIGSALYGVSALIIVAILLVEIHRITNTSKVVREVWLDSLRIYFVLEWFRLNKGHDPTMISFQLPFKRQMWDEFVDRYHQAATLHGTTEEQSVSVWVAQMISSMNQRGVHALDCPDLGSMAL